MTRALDFLSLPPWLRRRRPPDDVPPRSRPTAIPAGDIAAGEPVDDLPPMVEPTGFAEVLDVALPQADPPRRSFLPSLRTDPRQLETAAAQEMALPDIPSLVEPTRLPTTARESLGRRAAPMLSLWLRWKAAAGGLPALRMPRLALLAGGAAVVVIAIIAAAVLGGHGPAAPSAAPPRTSGPPPSSPADRLASYQKAADSGNAEAQLQLAILYAKGDGVAQDYAAAAKWFRAAADQGSARAQYDLGVLYERGRGVSVDLAQATKWYLKAAEGKYPLAQYNLAVCYTKGQGTRKDLSEAALWYRRAALQGVVQAMINLGTMYERGDGVPASPVDAYAWYLVAGRRSPQGSRRAEDVFATLPKLDQIRAEALAGDVAASIHDPKAEDAAGAVSPAAETTTPAAGR